jgi:hypothetical protein
VSGIISPVQEDDGKAFRTSGNVTEPTDDDLLTHPERYEVVEFPDWRLPSGRRVTFNLAIPKERYDGFELLRLLDIREQRLMTQNTHEG